LKIDGISRTGFILDTRQKPLCVNAPAKLNLGLRVIGRREDGYHFLESLFWPVDLSDTLIIQEGPFSVRTHWADGALRTGLLPEEKENLVSRAGALLGIPLAEVQIEKRIPLGAGLGGGSSDAGAFLRWALEKQIASPMQVEHAALSLGADVPFFLRDQPAWVEGVGEKRNWLEVSPAVRDSLSFLLVVPPFEIATPFVFRAFRQNSCVFSESQPGLRGEVTWENLKPYLAGAENSLEPIVEKNFPLIADILSTLRKTPCLYAGLSGSGSTCFAAYASTEQAREKAQELSLFFRRTSCSSVLVKTYAGLRVQQSKESPWKSPK
jgi:4-diphosphocytidyl-2-C-methyl-D-erythritol kinase